MFLRRLATTAGLVLALATPATAESLADALADSYRNSGLLDQNRALLRAADEDVAQSLAALRPVVQWSANYSWRESDLSPPGTEPTSANFELSASLLLYDGGASKHRTEAAKALVLETRQDLRGIEQDVLLRAATAYMNVRRNTEFVALRKSNMSLIEQELRAARDRFEVGEVTRTDVALAEARLAATRSELAAAEGSLAQSVEEFRAAVGRAPGNLDVVAPAPLDRGQEAARGFALGNHPSIKAAQQAVTAAELTLRAAKAGLSPSVNLRGSASVDDDGNATESLGVTFGGPIYSGGQLESAIRQATARRDAARAGLHLSGQSVAQSVGNAFAQLRVARASSEASRLQIRAARTAFEGVREEATLGARTTLDVLNAEQELLDARANGISAQADEVIASYEVLASMGLMTADHLGLAVQTYDPAAYYNMVKDAPATLSPQGRALDRVLESIGD
ncbi:TolC family outer membrane protein [Salibaculum halophilum]|uniref:TolC family outer membrane protein n=1 Tax=Salibaculum halophilum TaxID=1914408 RepID=UPI000A111FCC|nr:TolC family outer membrane protein [Salibaculum halophilum]